MQISLIINFDIMLRIGTNAQLLTNESQAALVEGIVSFSKRND